MKAITFHGVGHVRAEDVVDPKVVDATGVLLRITTSAVCGSDLHRYHGRGGGALVQTGAIMGHEFTLKMGICKARNYIRPLLPLVASGKLAPARIITHTLPLGDAPRGYAIFDRKEQGATTRALCSARWGGVRRRLRSMTR